MTGGALVACVALMTVGATAGAQVMSVSSSSVTLQPPDTTTYDLGLTPAASFTVMVTGCAGSSGCRTSLENPHLSSAVPINVQWRLSLVSQVGGSGSLGCAAVAPLLAWQSLGASPVTVMDTGIVSQAGAACVATLDVRATGVSYGVHQFTAAPTTYWREILFRVVEK
jgi:hypothetical protein